MTKKKMSKGFKIMAAALVVVALFILTGVAGGVYWFGLKADEEQETLKKQIAGLEKTLAGLRKNGTNGDTTTTPPKDPYAGWQTYKNDAFKVFVRYPAGWTYEEGTGSLHVTFLGPATSGGVITHECAFFIFVENAPPGMSLNDYVEAAQNEPMGGGTVVEEGPDSVGGAAAYRVVDTYMDVGHGWQRIRVWAMKNNQAYTFTYDASTNYNGNNYYTTHLAEAELFFDSIVLE